MKTLAWLLTVWCSGRNVTKVNIITISISRIRLKWLSRKSRRKRKCYPKPGSIKVTVMVPLVVAWRLLLFLLMSVIVMAVSCTLVSSEAVTHLNCNSDRANYDLNRTNMFNSSLISCSDMSNTPVIDENVSLVHHKLHHSIDLPLSPTNWTNVTNDHFIISVPLQLLPLPSVPTLEVAKAQTKQHLSISTNGSFYTNRTHSVQLININQTDAVNSIPGSLYPASLVLLAGGNVGLAVNSVEFSLNRVNLTNNIITKHTTLDSKINITTTNNNDNNTTNIFKLSQPDLVSSQRDKNHLISNLSSSAIGVNSISGNLNCTNFGSNVQTTNLFTANSTRTNKLENTTEIVKKANVVRANKGVIKSITWSQTSSTKEKALNSIGGDKEIVNWTIHDKSLPLFSQILDNSLTVSGAMDSVQIQTQINFNPASQSISSAPSVAPSSILDDPLATNYYRYSARDNDPNVLLSRYPSLRLPPPPPEFADEFNEGELIH